MAIAVIGGLITSTFLTLLVPVVFTYVDDFRMFLNRKIARFSDSQNG